MSDAIGRISSHIRRFVVMPPDVVGNPQAEFEVSLIPTGEVLNVKLSRSSGNPAYDNAVERAIRKASPLPLPADPSLVGRFRELKLKFRPNE
jgi:colicin import membrane protein